MFIGTDGISLSHEITAYDVQSASVTFKMAENADEVFLLCDSSKIEKNSLIKFAPLSSIDYLITDYNIDPSLVSKYQSRDIQLIHEEEPTKYLLES